MAAPTNVVAPGLQTQQNGLASSVRSPSMTSATRSPLDLNGGLERRPSATIAHHRQPSRAHGLYQHSRNTSYVNSPATSPLSPQLNGSASLNANATIEMSGLSAIHQNSFERRPGDSLAGSLHVPINNSSTFTLGGERDSGDVNHATITHKRMDRTYSAKGRRGHNHHRSQSKQQQLVEQKTVGEYALHHLFNSVSQRRYDPMDVGLF